MSADLGVNLSRVGLLVLVAFDPSIVGVVMAAAGVLRLIALALVVRPRGTAPA